MDNLTQLQAESLKKLSTDRLRSRLIKVGFEEDLMFATDRPELLNMMAEHMLKPEVADPTPDETTDIGFRTKELYLREQELRLREAELCEQAAAREQEVELRRAELRITEQRAIDEI